jgi:predicted ATP-dependent serine protease
VAATRSKVCRPLSKLATGIEGFDAMSGGGLPLHRTSLLLGGPGAGKTVFALQCLVNGARRVRRATINEAAGPLQRRGLISFRRGKITILDRKRLEAACCGCYRAMSGT